MFSVKEWHQAYKIATSKVFVGKRLLVAVHKICTANKQILT